MTSSSIQKIYDNIYKITLPLGGNKPGPVNVYLLTGKVITLIDTGILNTVKILQDALSEIDITFPDIQRIIITHGHVDHFGAARRIQIMSGRHIEIAASPEDLDLMENRLEVPIRQLMSYYSRMGVPYMYRKSLLLVKYALRSLSEKCLVNRYLFDGDNIEIGDYSATIIATPGHTRGSICLFLQQEGLLFSGDHIIEHITPNAFVMLEPGNVLPVRLSQAEYYDSISRIETLPLRFICPAHGKLIDNLPGTTSMYREQFKSRLINIINILKRGESTVYQIGKKLFPDVDVKRLPLEIYLFVSEVYSHMQILERDGLVTSSIHRGKIHFKLCCDESEKYQLP